MNNILSDSHGKQVASYDQNSSYESVASKPQAQHRNESLIPEPTQAKPGLRPAWLRYVLQIVLASLIFDC
jgi:hypothetical protein